MSEIDSIVSAAIAEVRPEPVAEPVADAPAVEAPTHEALEPQETQEPAPEGEATETASEISKEDAFANKTVQNALSRKDRKNHKLQQQLNVALKRAQSLHQQQPTQPPREEDFEGKPYSDFLAAHNKHAVETEFNQRDAKQAHQEVETAQNEVMQERKAHVDQSEALVREKLPDFDAVIDKLLTLPNGKGTAMPFSNGAWDLIQQSENPALAIYMIEKGGNLNALNNAGSHYEAVGMIQQAIQKGETLINPRTQSNAPEPIAPARGTGRGAKSLGELSADKLVERLLS
jgi:hypothetical protein